MRFSHQCFVIPTHQYLGVWNRLFSPVNWGKNFHVLPNCCQNELIEYFTQWIVGLIFFFLFFANFKPSHIFTVRVLLQTVMLLDPSKSNGNRKEGFSPKMSSDRKTEIGKYVLCVSKHLKCNTLVLDLWPHSSNKKGIYGDICKYCFL